MSFYLVFELVIKHHKTNLLNSKRTRISKILDTSFKLKTRAVNEKNTGEGALNFKRLISKQFKLAKDFAMSSTSATLFAVLKEPGNEVGNITLVGVPNMTISAAWISCFLISISFYLSPCLLLLLLHSVGSANKTFCDNDKFLLFFFRYKLVRSALTLHKPKYGSPILRKQHAYMQHHTTKCHAMTHYTAPLQDKLFVSNNSDL